MTNPSQRIDTVHYTEYIFLVFIMRVAVIGEHRNQMIPKNKS